MKKIEFAPHPNYYIFDYDPDWDYNPSELLRLAVWHKSKLPSDAIGKIKKAIDNALGRDGLGGRWALDEKEFDDLLKGFAQNNAVPEEIKDDFLEILKNFKK